MHNPAAPSRLDLAEVARLVVGQRRIVVTGGGGGLGGAIAHALVAGGASVAPLDLRAAPAGQFRAMNVDVTDREALLDAAKRLEDTWGQPADGLVNCAGVFHGNAAAAVSQEEWQRHLDVNLTGTFAACQVFGARMANSGGGSIVNVGSILGVRGKGGRVAYVASKHGVHGITKALADEWGPAGVRVNAIAPGRVETEMTAATFADREASESYLARVPLGRFGTLDDIVGAALFLLSELSSYVNGHALLVDGGLTANF